MAAAGRLSVAQLERLVQESQLRAALEAAADADIATIAPGSVVTFTHPLLASAIYDAATPQDRRRAHRALAEQLEDPVERARHRAQTTTAPDEAVACELEQAAEISLGRGAPQLAGELLERAALATPSGSDDAAGLRRWLSAVDTYMAAGDRPAARSALDKCAPLAALPEQHAKVLMRQIELQEESLGARLLAEEALRLAPPATRVRAETLYTLGAIHRISGNGEDASRFARRAVKESAAIRSFDTQLSALHEVLSIERHWGRGHPAETLKELDQLIETASPALPTHHVAWTYFFASWNDKDAEPYVRDAISSAVGAGRYGHLSGLYICLILHLIRASRVHDARAALQESDRIGGWTRWSFQEDMARILVAEYTGELDTARQIALSAAARAREEGWTYWLDGFLAQIGFVETSAGNWQAALAALAELAQVFAQTKMVELEQLLWAVDYADAALQLGAREHVETAISLLRRQGACGRPEATVAASRCEAMLAATRGNIDEALHTLRAVVAEDGIECPFEAARSQLALGQVYRRGGYKRMASDTLTQAAVTFEALGIPRWAERARNEASRTGLQQTTGELTEAERQVAEMVASGHSNQETAAALFMSVKTVEANLTRIYRKLSVRSRTELANRLNKPG